MHDLWHHALNPILYGVYKWSYLGQFAAKTIEIWQANSSTKFYSHANSLFSSPLPLDFNMLMVFMSKNIQRGHKLKLIINMLAGSCIWNAISKYRNGIPKVARKACNIGEVWNPVCCHGNKIVKLVLQSQLRVSRILLPFIDTWHRQSLDFTGLLTLQQVTDFEITDNKVIKVVSYFCAITINIQVHMLTLFAYGQIISSPEPEESEVKSSSLSSPEPVQPPPSSGVIASQLVTLQVQWCCKYHYA